MKQVDEGKFVIKLNSWGDYIYYASHGYFKGEENAISYTTRTRAKRFDTNEEAMDYIQNSLPEWTKQECYKHVVDELSDYELMLAIGGSLSESNDQCSVAIS